MSSYISEEFRRQVAIRADFICEYCLIHDSDMFLGCQVVKGLHQGSPPTLSTGHGAPCPNNEFPTDY